MLDNEKYKIVPDFSEVDLMDSSGLDALISIHKALQDKGDRVIYRINKRLAKFFDLARSDKIFTDLDEALEAFLLDIMLPGMSGFEFCNE